MPEFHDAPREIFQVPEIMSRIAVIQPYEEDKYSDVPKWDNMILEWTISAVLLQFTRITRPTRMNWFPFSQLRKAEDGLSVYATSWILDKKGF